MGFPLYFTGYSARSRHVAHLLPAVSRHAPLRSRGQASRARQYRPGGRSAVDIDAGLNAVPWTPSEPRASCVTNVAANCIQRHPSVDGENCTFIGTCRTCRPAEMIIRRCIAMANGRLELLTAIDVEGRAGDRGVCHEVDGQGGDVGRADDAADRQGGVQDVLRWGWMATAASNAVWRERDLREAGPARSRCRRACGVAALPVRPGPNARNLRTTVWLSSRRSCWSG
jgi:hypothetical protein